MKILICDKLDKLTIEAIEKIGDCIDVSHEENKKEKIKENIVDAEIVLIRSDTHLTKELISISENLKIIGRAGVGTDNIDLVEASKRNIHVTNTPEANVISAAELTVGLIISAARNITIANNSVKEKDLIKNKFNVVIYANHILRAAYPAMFEAGMSILKNQRSLEIDKKLAKIKDILKLIPGTI